LAETVRIPEADNPRCPHCGSKWTLEVYREWCGELPDGSIAPQPTVWECLDCSRFFTTTETD